MTTKTARKAKIGERLNDAITVLGEIDPGSKEPVYIVWHAKLWCHLACKIFATLDDATREAKTMSVMAHPYILPVLGVEKPGCLLMPYLEGRSVANMLDHAEDKRFTVSNAMRVAIHVGAALQHIHDRGFMHLDVKPDNVIVASGGRPILFDFGSARRITDCRPKRIIGTNAYIAPEECSLGDTGPEADVFSLGVMIHEMIAGDLPFGRSSKKAPFPQLNKPAVPLRRVRKGVPKDLEAIVLACLDRNPAQRPPLSKLLPALNSCITAGPKMWPEDFRPTTVPNGNDGRSSLPCNYSEAFNSRSAGVLYFW